VDEVRSVLGAFRYDISSSRCEEAFQDTQLTCNNYHFVDSKKGYPRDTYLRRLRFVAECQGYDVGDGWRGVLSLIAIRMGRGRAVRAPRPILVSCIDTKYYHNLPLRGFPPDTVYCSFGLNPKHAAYSDGDEGFYHLDGTKVVHHVSGGGTHVHRAVDDSATYASAAVGFGTTHYDCAHKPYPGDRLLTFWVPNAHSHFPPELLRPLQLAAPDMNNTVKQTVTGNFVSMDIVRNGDMWRSITGRNDAGSWCFEVPTSVVNACLDLKAAGMTLELRTIGHLVRAKAKDATDFDLVRFAAYIKSDPPRSTTTYSYGFGETKQTSQESVPTPFSAPALSATSDTENLRKAFELRMKKPVNNPKLPGSHNVTKLREEFVDHIFRRVGSLRPWSRADVEEYQDRRAQRVRNDAAANESSVKPSIYPVKAFVKLETSSGSCKPRQIVQLNTEFNLAVCSFSLPLSKKFREAFGPVLSETGQFRPGWYCVGASPNEVAKQMAVVARASRHAKDVPADCDYSSFDGSVSMFDRHLLKMVCMKVYGDCGPETLALLEHLLDAEAKLVVKKGDFKFQFEGQIVSGSGWTSFFGTLKNAFNWYCTLRAVGMNPAEAGRALHLLALFGDDGAAPKRLIEKLARVAECFGQKVTYVVREGRVSFLSRDFLVDDADTLDSMACMPRALQKLCCGLTSSDVAMRATCAVGNTPILGSLASKIVEFRGLKEPDKDREREAWYKHSLGRYPESRDERFVKFVAEDLGMTEAEVLSVEAEISSCKSFEELVAYLGQHRTLPRALPEGAGYVA
jgi:hypothetical protein